MDARQVAADRFAQRVRRAQRGSGGRAAGSGGNTAEPGADAAAFVAFSKLSDEMDELFVGADSPLLQLRANETPYDQLRTVPPERLLPVLLELLRASLPTSFDYLTNLTRTAIQNHLRPFMWLDRAFVAGPWGVHYPPSLPFRYRLSLREPLAVPWLQPPGRGLALLVVKAASAVKAYAYNDVECCYWVAERVLRELENEATNKTVQELAAAGVAAAAAALADLRYACHEACAQLLVAQAYRLELTGQRQELFAAFERHAAGLLRQRPDLPGAWALAALGHCRLVDHYKAQVLALRGLPVADAIRDDWNGAYLRRLLAGSIAMAGEAATPGKLRVGVLRRLIGEAALLQRRYRSWVPKDAPEPAATAGAVVTCFFDCRGSDKERIDSLPNDAVAPCFSAAQRMLLDACPRLDIKPRCGGCGQAIESDPKLCARCRAVSYHNAACQRLHWTAHRKQCQDVEAGGLDWAAEAAAAEAGLVACEQGGQGRTAEERSQRLGIDQLRAGMEPDAAGEQVCMGDLKGHLLGLAMATLQGQPPPQQQRGPAPGGAGPPPGMPAGCPIS